MNQSYNVINTLLRTEKSSVLAAQNKYFFDVRPTANKIQIKKAVEDLYKVKVASVNTQVQPGKKKRVRVAQGMTPEWKKAVVTLKTGHKIDIA